MRNLPWWVKLFKPILKPGRLLFRPTKRIYYQYKRLLLAGAYNIWAVQNEEECFVTENQREDILVSIVVPVYNPLAVHLLSLVYSVVNQHYQNWELILVNASSKKRIRQQTEKCAGIDDRIRVVTPEQNLGISANTNMGLRAAKGEYIAFVDHDDLLHPCALHSMVQHVQIEGSELIYSDEDKVSHDGLTYFEPLCKPKWSPDLLRNVNYINHLTLIKAEYIELAGYLRKEFDGAQDYDLLLRVIDICGPRIGHVPRVLYHWRAAKDSTAANISNKTYIFRAGRRAVQEHLGRNNLDAKARSMKTKPGWVEVQYKLKNNYSLVIGPVEKHRERVCAWWLEKLLSHQSGPKPELVVGEWFQIYAPKFSNLEVRYIAPTESKGEYWRMAVEKSTRDTLVCFQEAALPARKKSLEQLAAIAQNQPKSIVAPIITGIDGTINDAGLVDSSYGYQRLFNGYKIGEGTFFGATDWVRNVASLTLDIFAINKETFSICINNDHNEKLCAKYLKIPEGYNCISWGHHTFIYSGLLSPRPTVDNYFNQQLSWASYEINMKASSWGGYHDNADSE